MARRLSISYEVGSLDSHFLSTKLAMKNLTTLLLGSKERRRSTSSSSSSSSPTTLVVAQDSKFAQAGALKLFKEWSARSKPRVDGAIHILVITAKQHRRSLFKHTNIFFVTAEECSREQLDWANVVFVGMCLLSHFYKNSDLGKIRSTIEEDIMEGEPRSKITLETVLRTRQLQDTIRQRGGCRFDYWKELHCALGPSLMNDELGFIPDIFTHTFDSLFVLQSCAIRDIFSMAAQVIRGVCLRKSTSGGGAEETPIIRLYGSKPRTSEDWWLKLWLLRVTTDTDDDSDQQRYSYGAMHRSMTSSSESDRFQTLLPLLDVYCTHIDSLDDAFASSSSAYPPLLASSDQKTKTQQRRYNMRRMKTPQLLPKPLLPTMKHLRRSTLLNSGSISKLLTGGGGGYFTTSPLVKPLGCSLREYEQKKRWPPAMFEERRELESLLGGGAGEPPTIHRCHTENTIEAALALATLCEISTEN